MKITQKQLREIITEEVELILKELEAQQQQAAAAQQQPQKFDKRTARQQAAKGDTRTQKARAIGGMSPLEGKVVATLQALQKTLAQPGQHKAAPAILRYVQMALKAAQGAQQQQPQQQPQQGVPQK